VSIAYLRYLYLAHFSKPAGDRVLYRAIRRATALGILEIGIGSADRTVRLVELAQRCGCGEPVRYAAIDLFEGRGADQPTGLSLKETHRALAPSRAQVQLIPGNPAHALPRVANALVNMDLVIISADYEVPSLGEAWFYVPRMLDATSRVFLETRLPDGGTEFRHMPTAEIELLASGCRRRRAA
jgi:hypothetical protein